MDHIFWGTRGVTVGMQDNYVCDNFMPKHASSVQIDEIFQSVKRKKQASNDEAISLNSKKPETSSSSTLSLKYKKHGKLRQETLVSNETALEKSTPPASYGKIKSSSKSNLSQRFSIISPDPPVHRIDKGLLKNYRF